MSLRRRFEERKIERLELEADRGYWVAEWLKAKENADAEGMEVARIMGSITKCRIELHDIAGNY